MKIEQELIDKIEGKLNQQNALLAAIGAAVWSIPALVIWFLAYSYNPNLGPLMLFINGCLIGLAIRVHGKGIKALFALLAFTAHTSIVFIAFVLNLVVGGTIGAIFLFGLYILGATAAMQISRIKVPMHEQRAFYYLTSLKVHQSNKKIKNKWFIAIPLLILTISLTCYLTVIGFTFLSEYKTYNRQHEQYVSEIQAEENKNIDVTPDGLQHMAEHEILRYSFAYYSGYLYNKYGAYQGSFPHSEFKAKTILKYLVKHRDNTRAKFILGLLNNDTKGSALIKEAVEEGDKFAQLYSTLEYGCYSDPDLAMKLLQGQLKLTTDEFIKSDIESILYVGFEDVCKELENPDYSINYILNYKK